MQNRGRANQRHRTRKDLLSAAAQILRDGRTPTVAEVAERALVSRATAYRYFPSREALLVEAPLDGVVPTAEIFADDASVDPEERVDNAEAALHKMIYENEAQLRVMLAQCLGQPSRSEQQGTVPVRQNRRTPLIEAALAPARGRFCDEVYKKLCAALALVFGPESMVVFRDVLEIDEPEARAVKRWALRALVRAALEESQARQRRTPGRSR